MEEHDLRLKSKAELAGALEVAMAEESVRQLNLTDAKAAAKADIDRQNLDISQLNNSLSGESAEGETNLLRMIKEEDQELGAAKMRCAMAHKQGTKSGSNLHGLNFSESTSHDDIEKAVEPLTREEAIIRAGLRHGPSIDTGNLKVVKAVFGFLTVCMSGLALALLMNQIDLRAPISRPFGLFIGAVAGGLIAYGVSWVMRPWKSVGGDVARCEPSGPRLAWLLPVTLLLSVGLSLADAEWIVKINAVRAQFNSSQQVPLVVALGIGAILSSLYVWSHAYINYAVGYSALAPIRIKDLQDQHIKLQRQDPKFQTFSRATKEHLTHYIKEGKEVERREAKLATYRKELATIREQLRRKRIPLVTEPSAAHAARIDECEIALKEARDRVAVLETMRTEANEDGAA